METLHGSIQGGQIRIEGNPSLPEGARVEVRVVSSETPQQQAARKRIESFQGLTDWSDEDDRILAELEAARRRPSYRDNPENDPFR